MKKPLLVLLPGYDGDGSRSFAELTKLINHSFRTLVINYPYAADRTRNYTLDELVTYVHSEITTAGEERVQLAGFSLGGFVASRYAETYPHLVDSVTLISSSPVPVIKGPAKLMLILAKPVSKSRRFANMFARVYCSRRFRRLISKLPVPVPDAAMTRDAGYAIFGTLAHVIRELHRERKRRTKLGSFIPSRALLFADDRSFRAGTYLPVLSKAGIEVTIKPRGGHAESQDYWEQVGEFILGRAVKK